MAEAAGHELVLPPRELLGHRHTPGDPEALLGWLARAFGEAEAWVLALDMLVYGGLLASREPAASEATCRARLESLARLVAAAPGRPCYGFQTVRRFAGTVRAQGDLQAWREAHERPAFGPARARNHGINRKAIDLVAGGTLGTLALLQEDCAPHPELEAEHAALREHAASRGVAERVVLTPGADEGGRALVARALRELAGRDLEVAVHLAGDGARPALYEHVPLSESVAGQLAVAGAREVPPGAEAEAALLVWGPDPEPRDLWLEPRPLAALDPSVRLAPDAWAMADEVLAEGRAPGGVGVADVRFANGGDVGLLPLLRGAEETGRLRAYAGWNTAGNTLGCALAQLALGASLATRRERVLEDLAYQGRVRGLLRRWVERELGADVWDLGEPPGARARAEGFLEHRLRQVWPEHRLSPGWGELPAGHFLYFPWERLFEVEVL